MTTYFSGSPPSSREASPPAEMEAESASSPEPEAPPAPARPAPRAASPPARPRQPAHEELDQVGALNRLVVLDELRLALEQQRQISLEQLVRETAAQTQAMLGLIEVMRAAGRR